MEANKEIYSWRYSKDLKVMGVLMYLITCAENYKIDSSIALISEATGISSKGVRTAISILDSEGIITKVSNNKITEFTLWRMVKEEKKRAKPKAAAPKAKSFPTAEELASIAIPEHYNKWKEWIDYKAKIRDQYTTTKGASLAYKKLVELSTVTVIDYRGAEETIIDINKINTIVDHCIEHGWKGIFEPHDNSTSNNTGRTTQQDAERIAARHAIDAAQSSFDTEKRRAEIEAGIGLLI